MFVWWNSNSGIGMGRIREVSAAKIFVAPTCGAFPIWFPRDTPGLNVLPELDIQGAYLA